MAKGKSEYWLTPEGLLKIEGWARDGLTDEQIATNIGVSRSTLNEWKKKYPDISDALKRGKDIIDIQVENALLKRALGYRYTEVTKERIVDTGQKKRHGGESELTEKEWDFAIKYFNGRCCYCGEYMSNPTKDHIKPLNGGGTLSRENIIPCCQRCNSSKKDNEMSSWYQKQVFYSKERIQKIYDYVDFVLNLGNSLDEEIGQMVVTKEVTKEVVPDTTAQIFWLKNRRPDKWRDKQDVQISGALETEKTKLDDLLQQMRRDSG